MNIFQSPLLIAALLVPALSQAQDPDPGPVIDWDDFDIATISAVDDLANVPRRRDRFGSLPADDYPPRMLVEPPNGLRPIAPLHFRFPDIHGRVFPSPSDSRYTVQCKAKTEQNLAGSFDDTNSSAEDQLDRLGNRLDKAQVADRVRLKFRVLQAEEMIYFYSGPPWRYWEPPLLPWSRQLAFDGDSRFEAYENAESARVWDVPTIVAHSGHVSRATSGDVVEVASVDAEGNTSTSRLTTGYSIEATATVVDVNRIHLQATVEWDVPGPIDEVTMQRTSGRQRRRPAGVYPNQIDATLNLDHAETAYFGKRSPGRQVVIVAVTAECVPECPLGPVRCGLEFIREPTEDQAEKIPPVSGTDQPAKQAENKLPDDAADTFSVWESRPKCVDPDLVNPSYSLVRRCEVPNALNDDFPEFNLGAADQSHSSNRRVGRILEPYENILRPTGYGEYHRRVTAPHADIPVAQQIRLWYRVHEIDLKPCRSIGYFSSFDAWPDWAGDPPSKTFEAPEWFLAHIGAWGYHYDWKSWDAPVITVPSGSEGRACSGGEVEVTRRSHGKLTTSRTNFGNSITATATLTEFDRIRLQTKVELNDGGRYDPVTGKLVRFPRRQIESNIDVTPGETTSIVDAGQSPDDRRSIIVVLKSELIDSNE